MFARKLTLASLCFSTLLLPACVADDPASAELQQDLEAVAEIELEGGGCTAVCGLGLEGGAPGITTDSNSVNGCLASASGVNAWVDCKQTTVSSGWAKNKTTQGGTAKVTCDFSPECSAEASCEASTRAIGVVTTRADASGSSIGALGTDYSKSEARAYGEIAWGGIHAAAIAYAKTYWGDAQFQADCFDGFECDIQTGKWGSYSASKTVYSDVILRPSIVVRKPANGTHGETVIGLVSTVGMADSSGYYRSYAATTTWGAIDGVVGPLAPPDPVPAAKATANAYGRIKTWLTPKSSGGGATCSWNWDTTKAIEWGFGNP